MECKRGKGVDKGGAAGPLLPFMPRNLPFLLRYNTAIHVLCVFAKDGERLKPKPIPAGDSCQV
jgi:hypothetical protein